MAIDLRQMIAPAISATTRGRQRLDPTPPDSALRSRRETQRNPRKAKPRSCAHEGLTKPSRPTVAHPDRSQSRNAPHPLETSRGFDRPIDSLDFLITGRMAHG